VTPKLLSQIERAEAALFDLGFRELRVRHHGDVARLEVPEADLMRALQQRRKSPPRCVPSVTPTSRSISPVCAPAA
jgi:PP-loop superfamily ATP-utilizing enzyme